MRMLISLISMRMLTLTPDLERGDHLRQRLTSSAVLAGSSLLAIALSFVDPSTAMWGLLSTSFSRWSRDGVNDRTGLVDEPRSVPADYWKNVFTGRAGIKMGQMNSFGLAIAILLLRLADPTGPLPTRS